ncbi:ATP synthase subunit I [Waterburya agarophytonicola]|nr:ATP synthase subunit I [Waterburya agarophytonicola]
MGQHSSNVTLSNQSPEPVLVREEQIASPDSNSLESHDPMADFYQLQRSLLLTTLALTGIFTFPVWYFFSPNTAFNYLVGAITGLVYLKMLAKDVERLGQQRLGAKGLGIFVILILVASKWQQLHILPVFLGFLTYKPAIVIYTVKSIFWSAEKSENDA